MKSRNRERKRYLTIFGDVFEERVKPENVSGHPKESSLKRRTTKTNREIVFLPHPNVEGFIQEILVEDNDFGKALVLVMDSGGEKVNVSMGYDSSQAMSCLNRFLNPDFDINKEILLDPYKIARDDDPTKYNSGVCVFIGEDKIAHFINKDNKDALGVPAWDKHETAKGVSYNKDKVFLWMMRRLAKDLKEKGHVVESVAAKVFPNPVIKILNIEGVETLGSEKPKDYMDAQVDHAKKTQEAASVPVVEDVDFTVDTDDDLPF